MDKFAAPAVLCAACVALAAAGGKADAAENGVGFYLLGLRANGLAGVTPPPGLFYQNDDYFYSGGVSKSKSLPFDRGIVAGADATAILNLSTFLFVTPAQILGGNLAFSATVPIGGQDISGFLGPLKVQDSKTTIGDPIFTTFLGWHEGNFHWQTGVSVNVPVGDYSSTSLANISFHHWAADVYGSLTWLDPKSGLDLSNTIGITFNGENTATHYQNGTEFHWESAITQNLSKQFAMGLAAYYYDQITGDSGSGATLGSFEGRTLGVGPVLTYNFQLGILPVSARLKYFHEFAVKNRLQADAGFLTVSMPLWVPEKYRPK